jgi:hypothetical protein
MILLWGLPSDPPLGALREAIEKLGMPYRFLNQQETLKTEIELHIDSEITGVVRGPNIDIDLAEITGLYLRPHDSRRLPSVVEAGVDGAAGIRQRVSKPITSRFLLRLLLQILMRCWNSGMHITRSSINRSAVLEVLSLG